jgi:hypothetical protein
MYRPFLQNNRLLWAFLLVLGLGVGVQAQSLVNTAHVVDSAGGASESASYINISATGLMESIKDLVNCTKAEPGIYGAYAPKRFFRVRTVVKP